MLPNCLKPEKIISNLIVILSTKVVVYKYIEWYIADELKLIQNSFSFQVASDCSFSFYQHKSLQKKFQRKPVMQPMHASKVFLL